MPPEAGGLGHRALIIGADRDPYAFVLYDSHPILLSSSHTADSIR